ncbi:MAG: type II toxin-antitoxin system VapC family toxin [Candidatus Latescibacteria bacterium]|nr:type II toxin-antitoxin system VapC family toxin [Candidatus Latescibacterota bacterium]
MAKQSVYLDSTIPSAYYDSRTPERQGQTIQFWNRRLPDFAAVISSVVVLEIRATPNDERRTRLENLVQDCEVLVFDEEADTLAQEYVARGIFPEKYVDDANHVAVAVTNGIGYFCSWNFTHIVNVNIRREVNLFNALKGYGPIEIVAPPEL